MPEISEDNKFFPLRVAHPSWERKESFQFKVFSDRGVSIYSMFGILIRYKL